MGHNAAIASKINTKRNQRKTKEEERNGIKIN